MNEDLNIATLTEEIRSLLLHRGMPPTVANDTADYFEARYAEYAAKKLKDMGYTVRGQS